MDYVVHNNVYHYIVVISTSVKTNFHHWYTRISLCYSLMSREIFFFTFFASINYIAVDHRYYIIPSTYARTWCLRMFTAYIIFFFYVLNCCTLPCGRLNVFLICNLNTAAEESAWKPNDLRGHGQCTHDISLCSSDRSTCCWQPVILSTYIVRQNAILIMMRWVFFYFCKKKK